MNRFVKLRGVLVGLVVLVVMPQALAFAQQQTGPVLPATGNPQEGPIQPFQQRGGLQEASSFEALGDNLQIIIPAGTPAPAYTVATQVEQHNLVLWLVVVLGLMVLGLVGWRLIVSRRSARLHN